MKGKPDSIKRKLSAVVERRNLIAHNGDFDEGLGRKLDVSQADATEVIDFISDLVHVIDGMVA
ncbi:MAG: hypothetical protein V4753_13985 [Pseudomonadota bacterium]